MAVSSRWHFLKTVGFWIQIVSAVVGIATGFAGYPTVGIASVVSVLIAINAYLAVRYYNQTKDDEAALAEVRSENANLCQSIALFPSSFQPIHDLLHEMRDAFREDVVDDLLAEVQELPNRTERIWESFRPLISGMLDRAAELASRLTGKSCTASFMLLADDGQHLETMSYSSNASVARKARPSRLPHGTGVAWRAIEQGRAFSVSDCNDADSYFLKTREDHGRYYRSFVSSPFRANGAWRGVFHLDCEQVGVFRPEHVHLAMAFGDGVALALQLINNLVDITLAPEEEQP